MKREISSPTSLQEAIISFSDYQHCHKAVSAIRWPDGIIRCPICGSEKVTYLANQRRWKCYGQHPKPQFSLKVGTIFEDSPIPLEKWLPALWLLTNCKNGISSYELARALKVTQKTAWFMLSRLRLALQDKQTCGKLSGHVEVDETYIGGKARNMHWTKRARFEGKRQRWVGKMALMGLLERHNERGSSRVRLEIVPNTRRRQLQRHVREHVVMDRQTIVYSDALPSYIPKTPKGWRPSDLYIHKVIDHGEAYAEGNVHTNGLENFWSLLKRAISGTYVSVEPFHLFRYRDEQAFRFNNRVMADASRFALALKGVLNKRLTYINLTGSELLQTC